MKGFLKNLISGKGGDIINAVGDVADKFITTPHEKEQFNAEVQKEINRHLEAMTSEGNKELELHLNDVANARAMQITALQQDDKFSKRFVYYLALGVLSFVCIYDILFFFVDYPERNHDIINMIAGTLNGSALVSIIFFYFGSSKSSSDKQKKLDEMIK